MFFALYVNLKPINIIKFKHEDYLIVGFIFVHIYGVLLALYFGNNPTYIIRNFAGIVLYLTYFIISSLRLSFNTLIKLVRNGILVYLSLFFMRIIFDLSFLDKLLVLDVGSASSGQSRIFSGFFAVFAIFIGTSLYYFEQKKQTRFALFMAISIYLFIFLAASKGFALILIFLSVLYVFMNIKAARKRYKLVFIFLFFYFSYNILEYAGYSNIVTNIFAEEDTSNIVRYEQVGILLSELNIFGHGVGATFSSYIRNDEFPYAIEIVYLNLFHKFGIFGFIYIYGIIYTFYKLSKVYQSEKDRRVVLELMGLMGYSIAALGNPSLFAPSFVVIHCIVLYYLRYHSKPWFGSVLNKPSKHLWAKYYLFNFAKLHSRIK